MLADPLLRFSMLVYICVPGVFTGVNVTGMFYLQNVANMSPAATGMLMPLSVASFIAITATGRYFNRIGPPTPDRHRLPAAGDGHSAFD